MSNEEKFTRRRKYALSSIVLATVLDKRAFLKDDAMNYRGDKWLKYNIKDLLQPYESIEEKQYRLLKHGMALAVSWTAGASLKDELYSDLYNRHKAIMAIEDMGTLQGYIIRILDRIDITDYNLEYILNVLELTLEEFKNGRE